MLWNQDASSHLFFQMWGIKIPDPPMEDCSTSRTTFSAISYGPWHSVGSVHNESIPCHKAESPGEEIKASVDR